MLRKLLVALAACLSLVAGAIVLETTRPGTVMGPAAWLQRRLRLARRRRVVRGRRVTTA